MLASANLVSLRFNSRSPSGLRRLLPEVRELGKGVSIHAAQAGCDQELTENVRKLSVSIHAAQAGCDL